LQLITIRNSYDGNNIKPETIKRVVNFFKSLFYTLLSKVQLIILSSALECTKNNTLWPLAQKGCVHLPYKNDTGNHLLPYENTQFTRRVFEGCRMDGWMDGRMNKD